MERLVIGLPKDTDIFQGPSTDSEGFSFPKDGSVFVHPLNEQSLAIGTLVVSPIDKDGKVSTDRFHLPIIEGRKDQLEEALTVFQNLPTSPSNEQKLKLMGEIETCLFHSEVVGPEDLKPF